MAMIASLSPHSSSPSVTDTAPVASRPPNANIDEASDNEYEPQTHWSADDYRRALGRAIGRKSAPPEAEQRIYDAFLKSPLGQSEEERDVWEARREYIRLIFHKSNSMKTLLECSKRNPNNPRIQRFIGFALKLYDQFSDSAKAFERGARHAMDKDSEIEMLCEAAIAHHQAGEVTQADDAINRARVGNASSLEYPKNLPETWVGKECKLSVSVTGSEFVAIGEYEEEPPSGLINAFSSGSNQDPTVGTPYRVEYRGKIKGRTIEARKTRQNLTPNLSLMSAIPSTSDVLLYISTDGQRVVALESRKNKFSSLYEWHVA